MEPRTLKALKADIAHWDRLAQAKAPGAVDFGFQYSCLCEIYNKDMRYWVAGECPGCPVAHATRKALCGGTNYELAKASLIFWKYEPRSKQWKNLFQKFSGQQANFLRALVPASKGNAP